MPVRTRLLVLITLLVTACSLGTAGMLAWLAWRSILARAVDDAVLLAHLLADSASVSEQAALEAEDLLGDRMLAEAYLAGQLVDLGQRQHIGETELRNILKTSAAHTGLQEIWIVNPAGKVVLSSLDEIDESIADEFDFADRAAPTMLRAGRIAGLVTEPVHRAVDDRTSVYAGVRTDTGAALVAQDASFFTGLRDQLGLQRLIDTLLGGRTVEAIWVFDDQSAVRATGTTSRNDQPRPAETALAAGAMRDGHAATLLTDNSLSVAVPILDRDRVPSGAAMVRLPTAELRAEIQTYFAYALALSAGLLALGLAATTLTARRLSQPIQRLTGAARAVERREFDPDSLTPLLTRRDEFGRLASVFRGMAVELLGRERELDRLVQERTAELQHTTDELSATYAQIAQELDTAQALQRAILPQRFPDRPEIAGHALMVPARQLAGDFYDVLELADGRIGLLIADVSGKGVPAAFFMGISRTVLRAAALQGRSPGECLAQANKVLCATNPMDLFVTVFYGILDPADGTFVYANGGHNPPLHWRRDRPEPALLEATGSLVLGMFEGVRYAERSLALDRGDLLLLYTDGVTEAMSPAGEEFSELRLIRAVASAGDDPEAIVARITAALHEFTRGEPAADDVTCLVLRYDGSRPELPAAVTASAAVA